MGKHRGSPGRNTDIVHVIGGSVVKFCAVYVTGDGEVGYTRRLPGGARRYADVPADARHVWWVQDWKLARRIVKGCWPMPALAEAVDVVQAAAWAERIKLYTAADLKKLETTKGELRWKQMERMG
jgi:hypothetical protein